MESTITKQWLGEILRVWVRLPDRSAVQVADDREGLPEIELVKRAVAYWKYRDTEEMATNTLRQQYPNKQVIIGFLPCHNIDTTLNGHFAYVLKNRRSHGKYQIQEYIQL